MHFLQKLEVDGVVAEHGLLVAAFEIQGDKEWPVGAGIDFLAGTDAENLGDFQEQAARLADHFFNDLRGDIRAEFVEGDVVDHGG